MTLRAVDIETGEVGPLLPNVWPKGIVAKLADVLGKVERVPKKGRNRAQNYDFVTESDLVDFVRPLLAERMLFLHQSIITHERQDLYKTQSGNMMMLTTVTVDFTWADGETGETLPPQRFMGYGADTGDKGLPKALTSATKYLMLKTFLISTGDDPEADEKVDKAQAATEAAQGPRVTRRAPTAGQQRGGHSTVPTAPQIAEFSRLVKEAGLKGDEVIDLIGRVLKIDTAAVEHTGAGVKNFIQRLSAEQVAMLIRTLSEPTQEEPTVDAAGDDTGADDLGF
jgi:hypothetical protein